MGKLRSIAWGKPKALVCIALSLYIPFFYFESVNLDLFIVSKNERQNHGTVVTSKTEHTSLRQIAAVDPPASQLLAASGQHLLLDMVGGSFDKLNDEQYLRQATLNIVKETKMTLLGIQSHKLDPQGVSVVALLAESHLSIHTWPEHGSALIDVFTCGSGRNLQEHLDYVIEQYGGNVTASTYSVMFRGQAAKSANVELEDQFQPAEIMTIHKYKRKVFEVQSPYQHISIWDHHDTQEDDFEPHTTRSLFLDGVIQSNEDDEEKYHESLVHPAFTGSSLPPKRVLIVGGGEGGTLRESLKYASVEKVVMVELDAAVIEASREYLPSYSNCTGFGTPSCFDDKRVELYTEDFIKWFDDHIGNDICQKASEKKDLLFDVIILDLLDTESLPEGEAWAEHLYSDLFFQRIACAVNRFGVVVTNFGEAPDGPFENGPPTLHTPYDIARAEMFYRKIKQIQTMSKFFHSTRVYDTSVPSYRANWAFAVGMVPRLDGDDDDEDDDDNFDRDIYTFGNQGINDFDGKAARVNLKLRRGLLPNAHTNYYDGAVQHGFQYPTGDWAGVYCSFPENKQICDLPSLFPTDYEEEFFEKRLTAEGGTASGIYAKKDIKKGHMTGLYDAATSLEIPSSLYYQLRQFSQEYDAVRNDMFNTFYFYGFDGGLGGLGETVYVPTSSHAFANHACDHKPNYAGLAEVYPYITHEFWEQWNPVADRFRSEISHITIAMHDIKRGEMITDDYTRWDGYMHSKGDKWGHPLIKEWCGKDYQ